MLLLLLLLLLATAHAGAPYSNRVHNVVMRGMNAAL
jgi:hypothetical protein